MLLQTATRRLDLACKSCSRSEVVLATITSWWRDMLAKLAAHSKQAELFDVKILSAHQEVPAKGK